eukprot:2342858-Amphidinium_carterae.2
MMRIQMINKTEYVIEKRPVIDRWSALYIILRRFPFVEPDLTAPSATKLAELPEYVLDLSNAGWEFDS